MSISPRKLTEADFDWVLALSAGHEVETGKLDRTKLAQMAAAAYSITVIGERGCYLITFDQDSAYDSPNFIWFRARYPRFVYVDRIVVDPAVRGAGFARALYEDFFARARADGHKLACCEINLDPPNPGSDAFHARMGFAEVGQAKLANGKSVRYLTRSL
ncbi:MAG: GNAT family N-acetyltransferase [Hyphomonadaceae bacterium]|nr:GNAT family N-acetyltransferase [Hyphomonadaceae bacterium]